MKSYRFLLFTLSVFIFIRFFGCGGDDSENNASLDDLPEVFMKFDASIQMEINGDFVVLESEGVPEVISISFLHK